MAFREQCLCFLCRDPAMLGMFPTRSDRLGVLVGTAKLDAHRFVFRLGLAALKVHRAHDKVYVGLHAEFFMNFPEHGLWKALALVYPTGDTFPRATAEIFVGRSPEHEILAR